MGPIFIKKTKKSTAFGLDVNREEKHIGIRVLNNPRSSEVMTPISQKSSATCPLCGYTTPARNVRLQLEKKAGGSNSCRLLAVVVTHPEKKGKLVREPNPGDFKAIDKSNTFLLRLAESQVKGVSMIPDEDCPPL